MSLNDLFDFISANPTYVVLYFAIIPVLAILFGWLDRGRGHNTPWRYLYSALIYLVAVPGIFALTLNIYLFLFERGHDILDSDLITQVLPIVSMILTLGIIRQGVDLDYIPGFDKLSGLLMIIFAALAIMWFIDRLRIVAFMRLPAGAVICIFVALLILIRYGWGKAFGSPYRSQR